MLVGDVVSPPISAHVLLTRWQTDGWSIVALGIEVFLALGYSWSVRRLARRGRRWSPWRSASFVAATLTVVVALQSGMASYDDSVFVVHAMQHLLLMTFAPILYALSAPMTLLLQASSRKTQKRVLAVLHTQVVELVTHPAVVAVLAYGTMIGYFLTPFYRFSLEHPVVHELTHLHFLVSGIVFWWVVVGIDPARRRLSYLTKLGLLGAGIPVTAILGVALTGARSSVAVGFHSVADTHAGGSVLWVVGELTTVAAMGIIVFQWMRFEEREAARADRRLDAQEAAQEAALATALDGTAPLPAAPLPGGPPVRGAGEEA